MAPTPLVAAVATAATDAAAVDPSHLPCCVPCGPVQLERRESQVKDYAPRKAELLDLLRHKLRSCASGESSNEWRDEVRRQLLFVHQLNCFQSVHGRIGVVK